MSFKCGKCSYFSFLAELSLEGNPRVVFNLVSPNYIFSKNYDFFSVNFPPPLPHFVLDGNSMKGFIFLLTRELARVSLPDFNETFFR